MISTKSSTRILTVPKKAAMKTK
jgi:hypothetical protein